MKLETNGRTFLVTYETASGYSYTHPVEEEEDYLLSEGLWTAPFSKDSIAYGFLEALIQSDYCPLIFHEEPIHEIMLSEIT